MAPSCLYSNVETHEVKKMAEDASGNVFICLGVALSFTYNRKCVRYASLKCSVNCYYF